MSSPSHNRRRSFSTQPGGVASDLLVRLTRLAYYLPGEGALVAITEAVPAETLSDTPPDSLAHYRRDCDQLDRLLSTTLLL